MVGMVDGYRLHRVRHIAAGASDHERLSSGAFMRTNTDVYYHI